MCFSASASFIAGGTLAAAGIASVKKTSEKKQLAFALIPFIFSVQQFCEGFVWLSINNAWPYEEQKTFTRAFLFFAQVLWPFYVPLSVFLLERVQRRKLFLKIFLIAGITVSVYHAACLLIFPVSAVADTGHIKYELGFPLKTGAYTSIMYIAATVLPCLFSSFRRVQLTGLFILGSFLLSVFFYRDYLISVWCFFAAIISILIYGAIKALSDVDFERKNRNIPDKKFGAHPVNDP